MAESTDAAIMAGGRRRVGDARWLLALPLLLALLASCQPGRDAVLWLDARLADLVLFRWAAGPAPEHDVVVVARDDFGQRVLGRAPTREDFATALQVLASSGARVALFDFIFDEPGDAVADARLAAAFAAFPTVVLGQRFERRRRYGLLEVGESAGDDEALGWRRGRSPPPRPLHEPLARHAADRALVNIMPDWGDCVRYMPVAYQTTADNEMLPTLGCAGWLYAALHDQLDAATRAIRERSSSSPDEGARILAVAPFPFRPTGHAGVDRLIRRTELRWLASLAAGAPARGVAAPPAPGCGPGDRGSSSPWTVASEPDPARFDGSVERSGATDLAAALTALADGDHRRLPPRTFVRMPAGPWPFIGSPAAPCLRLSLARADPPRTRDGIRVISMGVLVGMRERANQAWLQVPAGLPVAVVDRAAEPVTPGVAPLPLAFALTAPGIGALTGFCSDLAGRPVPGVEAWCWQMGGGYWERTTTGADGRFRLDHLPAGRYEVELVWSTPTTAPTSRLASMAAAISGGVQAGHLPASGTVRQRLTLAAGVAVATGPVEVPPARVLSHDAALSGPITVATGSRLLVIEGDALWLATTDARGRVPLASLPIGMELVALDDGPPATLAPGGYLVVHGPGPVFTTDGGVETGGRTVALIDRDPVWERRFRVEAVVSAGSDRVHLDGLPPGREVDLALLVDDHRAGTRVAKINLDLKAEKCSELSAWPAPTPTALAPRRVSFTTSPWPAGTAELAFRGPDGASWFAPASTGFLALRPGRYRGFAAVGPSAPAAGARRGTLDQLRDLVARQPVFFGTHLAEDLDFQPTPINFLDGDFKTLPGVNLHAHLASQLQRGDFLRPTWLHEDASPIAWPWWQLVAWLPLLWLAERVFTRGGAIRGGLAVGFLATGWVVLAMLLFRQHLLLPLALPLLFAGSFGVTRGYHAYAAARAAERQTRATFARFVSASMVDEMLRHPEAVRPGGDKRELTVMFTDLAGFTTISERLSPVELTALMNEYLGEMTDVLFAHGGTLDKYIGDAIMGFWNYPAAQPDHPLRAARCAIAMQRRLAGLRQSWCARGLPTVAMRAGIHTAECVVGFVGSTIQLNFTCLGDGVNLASRLEGANKAYGTAMMISAAVHDRLAGSGLRTRLLDFLAVKGKHEAVRVYELIDHEAEGGPLWDRLLPVYDRGINSYLARDWDGCRHAMREVLALRPVDGPAATFVARCDRFAASPPAPEWDGRFELHEK